MVYSTICTSLLVAATLAQAASLQPVANFGENPTKLSMSIYVPDKLAAKPPVIIVPHPCGGSASDTYGRVAKGLPAYADKLGFVLIFPQTPNTCWDCISKSSLRHNGGGDSQGLVNMVQYALDKYKGDPSQVFVTGSSSGGMMTNVLVGAYPDVFAAGASFSGAPDFACWAGAGVPASGADPSCATTTKPTTAQQWGDLARGGDAAFNTTATAKRPRMQIWHGTADNVVSYSYLANQLDQWSNVLGVTFSKNVTNDPETGYTKMVYGDGTQVVGYSAQGVGHMVPFHEKQVLDFFGLLPATA
ncbi:hypothetical protein SBRCBS47491_004417 [Sporothrix bragantina]|uniref:Carboxylic ester hydrolase n=1 Tax=Sporothrix bragantina TaxID=671064 RepID=A0ABP0BPJ9_9PEZI